MIKLQHLYYGFIALLLIAVCGCANTGKTDSATTGKTSMGLPKTDMGLPQRDKIPPKSPLPIDGLWLVEVLGTKSLYRADRGRVYVVKSDSLVEGTVILKNITKISDDKYAAEVMLGEGIETLQVISPDEILDIPRTGFTIGRVTWRRQKEANETPSSDSKVLAKHIDIPLKKVVSNEETIILPFGVKHTCIKDNKKSQTVQISNDWKVNAEVRGAILAVWGGIEADIKAEMSSSSFQREQVDYGNTDATEIVGVDKPATKYLVQYLDCYKTGRITVETNKGKTDVPVEEYSHSSVQVISLGKVK